MRVIISSGGLPRSERFPKLLDYQGIMADQTLLMTEPPKQAAPRPPPPASEEAETTVSPSPGPGTVASSWARTAVLLH